MSNKDEQARAAHKSREWKARQAEIVAAIAATEDSARESRAAVERERIELVERHRESSASLVIFEFTAIAIFLFIAVLLVERYIIEGNVNSCFAPPARALHQGNCANTIAASRWWWLLPSEQKELIRAKQLEEP